ncbi:fibronectin type III domain-containing protein [uncultured Nocardioides sp.]|uniref:fibronectin type III domain-containing protein n=1 Tax=uncultured Nocardioides sp. TaxID=198441 RepID=UPI002686FF31
MHRRRPFRLLLALLLAASGPLAAFSAPAAAAPPAPEVTSWAVDGMQVFVNYTYSPTAGADLLRFEGVIEVDGRPTREQEWPADTRWLTWADGQAADGARFTMSLRAVDTSGPGAWAVIEGALGGRLADAPTGLKAESRAQDDVIALSWTPPPGEPDARYEVVVRLAVRGPDDARRFVVDEPRADVPHALGYTPGSFEVRALTESGYGYPSPELEFIHEDQWAAPVWMQLKSRAGGFFVAWRSFKKSHKTVGRPDSWLVEVDGQPVGFQFSGGIKDTVKGFVRGLTHGTEHVVTVRGVTADFGPGLPISATGRTFAAAEQMAAPRVKPGRRGGDRTVLVSWGDPEWGEASPCCFRVTAVGRGAGGKKTTIRRFVGADLRRTDFGVGTTGPWRFTVEAKTGTGFSPVSGFSPKVRAR